VGEKVSLCSERFGQEGELARCKGKAPHRKALQRGSDPLAPLFGLERAHRIDQPPARTQQPHRRLKQGVLQSGERGKVGGAAEMGNVGMAADGAGAAAGSIEQDGIECRLTSPEHGIGRHHLGCETKTGKISLEPLEPLRIAIERHHVRPGGRELRRLAPGSSTKIGNPLSGPHREEAGGERGRDVLNEEPPFGKPLELRHRGSRRKPPGAVGQRKPDGKGPLFTNPGEIERWLAVVLKSNRARLLPPAPPQPRRGVEPRQVEIGKKRLAPLGDAPQHGIDKPGKGNEATPARQRHRRGHRRMGRGVEEEESRSAEPEDVPHLWRRGAPEMGIEHRIECAEVAERGGGQTMRCGAVTRGEGGQSGESGIERAALVEDRGQEMEGSFTGGIGHGPLSWLNGDGVRRGKARLAALCRRAPRLVLLLFALACWLPGLFTLPPSDRDESRFAQATRQMWESGDFVRIMNGDEPRNRKPIGIYWLQLPFAAAAESAGLARTNPIWPYRLPSLLGALVAVFATRRLGVLLFSETAGLWGGLWLAASLLLSFEARIAKTDAALLGATTWAVVFLAEILFAPERFRLRHALLFWVAVGAGVLIKGPITPLIVFFPSLFVFWQARDRRPWHLLRPALGLPFLLLVVLPWFIAIGIATHGAFFSQSVGGDLGRKLAGGDDAHGAPFGTYLALVFVTFFPGSLLLLPALANAFRQARARPFLFLFAWLFPSWLIFELVPTKLPHYVLPLYPALALLTAAWMTEGPASSRLLDRLSGGIFLLALAAIGGGLAALAVVSDFPSPRTALGLLPLLPLGALGLAVFRGTFRGTGLRSLAPFALAAAPFLYFAAFALELPHLEGIWVSVRVARDVAALEPAGPFGAAGYAEPSLRFLAGTQTRFFANGAEAARFLAENPAALVAIERRSEPAFQEAARGLGLSLEPRGVERGFNYSKGSRVSLTLYEAAGAGEAAPRREVK
jgi:4-amino-4-deoxy-L-arabinose transferase-like glycosyltransferase